MYSLFSTRVSERENISWDPLRDGSMQSLMAQHPLASVAVHSNMSLLRASLPTVKYTFTMGHPDSDSLAKCQNNLRNPGDLLSKTYHALSAWDLSGLPGADDHSHKRFWTLVGTRQVELPSGP